MRGMRKQRRGVVVSRSGDKTIVVRVETRGRHPKYGKVMSQYAKFHAHDEKNEARVGDTVRISETRPLSRLKRWRLLEILARGAGVEETAAERPDSGVAE
ncbi:MAG: 30S ribosomal protein S17 [Verrucomicrobiota bacterium]|nr:30S ribosomal protein S17 [Verrucomicrobiota bacterium]